MPLLRIEEPHSADAIPVTAPRFDIHALLELGFRPLYLVGTSWALLAIGIWIFAPQWTATAPLAGLVWHAHEMLWGFIATIAVGFLLTAGATWTGINPLHGRPLGLLCCLWAFARLGFLAPGQFTFFAAAAAEFAFFALAGAAMLRVVLKSHNRRNYGVPFLLFALGAIDVLYLLGARAGTEGSVLMQFFEAALLCMAIVALLVGRRVIPFFAMRALPALVLPMHTRSGQWQIGAAVIAMAFVLAGHGDWAVVPLIFAAAVGLVQTLSWQPWAARHIPILWILYVGYALLNVGLLLAAARASGQPLRAAWPVHLIAMGGLSVLIIGMMTRTALGHLGRPLTLDRGSFGVGHPDGSLQGALRMGGEGRIVDLADLAGCKDDRGGHRVLVQQPPTQRPHENEQADDRQHEGAEQTQDCTVHQFTFVKPHFAALSGPSVFMLIEPGVMSFYELDTIAPLPGANETETVAASGRGRISIGPNRHR